MDGRVPHRESERENGYDVIFLKTRKTMRKENVRNNDANAIE